MSLRKITEVDLDQKRIIIRADFNIPLQEGRIISDTRIRAALPTIEYALKNTPKQIILLSHLGRPTEGQRAAEFSLAPVAECLSNLLNTPVPLIENWLEGIPTNAGKIVLAENTRFEKGEKANDLVLAKKIANLCDVFVMDAFAAAHRAEASTFGAIKFAPIACMGLLFAAEIEALSQALEDPEPPLLAIIGGAKISTKLHVLQHLLNRVNGLIIGGGMANTFLAAKGHPIGQSLSEAHLIPVAQELLNIAQDKGVAIYLPKDVMVGTQPFADSTPKIRSLDQIQETESILDIGPETISDYQTVIQNSKTILWNGPLGMFELPNFAAGTRAVAQAIAESKAFSVAGGGDTIAAIEQFSSPQQFSYISTAGGAFLEFIGGQTLPVLSILEECS